MAVRTSPRDARTGAPDIAHDTFPRTLGEWIAELRLARRKVVSTQRGGAPRGRELVRPWARADLAERASISEPTMYRIETNAELPRFEVLEALLRALDVFPWQAQMLRDMWIARAADPARPRPPAAPATIRESITLLERSPFPALILDELYYVKASNRYMATVTGRPSGADLDRPNLVLRVLATGGTSRTYNYTAGGPTAAVWRSVRRFLLHSAPWSTTADYAPLIGELEKLLPAMADWRTALAADDDPGGDRYLSYHLPEIGQLDFVLMDQMLGPHRSVVLRTFVPVAGSLEAVERMRAVADRAPEAPWIADDWKAILD